MVGRVNEEETIHITTEEDMEVYDRLPAALRRFLATGPLGLDATSVNLFYADKLKEGWTPSEAQSLVVRTLRSYMQRAEGVNDFRPVEVIPARKKPKRPMRQYRLPRRLTGR
jgi:hypothetical protein